MKLDNKFQYAKSQHVDQLTALQAEMRDFSYGKHAHEEYSFGVTLAGRQDFFASGTSHHSYPGNIIIFNPGQVHDGHSGVDDALQYRMLYVHPDQFEPMLRSAGVKQSRNFQIKETLLDDPLLRQHILNLAMLIQNEAAGELQQECALYQLAARSAQLFGRYSLDDHGRKVDSLMRHAQDFIHANIQTVLSLDEISQQANLSKYNRAREELESGALLDDVVFNYGFSDLSHFNRRFKPIYGMTPRQYQRHFLNGKPRR